MLKRWKQAWKRDRLGVLGVGSAVVALVLWAFPIRWMSTYHLTLKYGTFVEKPFWEELPHLPNKSDIVPYSVPVTSVEWFSGERLPAIGAFLVLAGILLLLRRR